MSEEADWGSTVEEWLVAEKCCVAGGLAGLDGNFYATAPVAEDAGWNLLHKEPYTQKLAQEDGTDKDETIDEAAIFAQVAAGTRPKKGLWIAGEKYTVTLFAEEEEVEGQPVKVSFASASGGKKGVTIVVTSTSIVVGMFNEEKDSTTTKGTSRISTTALAEFLIQSGC